MRLFILLSLFAFTYNIVSAQTSTRGGVVSNISAPGNGKTYALVVGISDYKELPKLQYADVDATVFANMLKRLVGADSANVSLITNADANKVNILSKLVGIKKKAVKGDKIYIYFAGHGDIETEISNGGVLLLHDSYKESYYLNSNGILHQDDLKNLIAQISTAGAQVFLITDACHSGSLSGGTGGAEKSLLALKEAWGNESKIFSCQANELSMEGKQWGDGRGLFSFHLVEGMTGLADDEGDADGNVSLFELQSYLQKYVRKQAAPNKQTPFVVGNLDNNINAVQAPLLAKLKDSKTNNYPMFASAAGRSNEAVIADAANYTNFKNAIAEKRLVEPDKNNASYYYTILTKSLTDVNAKDQLQRQLVSALLDKMTVIIAPLLQGDVSYTSSSKVALAVKESNKAIELLGPDHYLTNNFKARKLFLEAVQLTLNSSDEKNPTAVNGAIAKLNESIKLEPYAFYSYYQLGYLYTLQKNSAKAVENYNKYLGYLPKDPEALNNIGVAYYKQGDNTKAIEYYQRSVTLKPSSKAYLNMGLAYSKAGKKPEADKAYNDAINLDKDKAALVRFVIAKTNYEDKKYDDAIAQLNKALETNKTHAPTYYYSALCQLAKKDTVKATASLNKAIELDAAYAEPVYTRGEVLLAQGNYDKAAIDLDRALVLNPKLWSGYLLLGKALVGAKKYQKAAEALENAMMMDRQLTKTLSLQLANIYRDNLNAYERANGYYQKYIELNPMDAKGHAEAGKNFTLMKNYTAAEASLKKAGVLSPSDITVTEYQQQLNAAMGK